MTFPHYWPNHGWHRQWTQERVLQQLAVAASEIEGLLPTESGAYSRMRTGKIHWPGATRILEYHGSMLEAWRAVGVDPARLKPVYIPWTQEDDDYLLERAGELRLTTIAKHLGRSYQAVRVRIGSKGHGLRARWNQGLLSAANVAAEYHTSYTRVCRLIADGTIAATRHPFRRQWSIEPEAITPEVVDLLRAPLHTYLKGPVDVGDYAQRHRIYRTRINGRPVYVREDGEDRCVPLSRPWTAEEDAYLSLHPDESPAVQAAALGRTRGAVNTHRSILAARGGYRLSRRRRSLATILEEAGASCLEAIYCCNCGATFTAADDHRCAEALKRVA